MSIRTKKTDMLKELATGLCIVAAMIASYKLGEDKGYDSRLRYEADRQGCIETVENLNTHGGKFMCDEDNNIVLSGYDI